MTDPAVVEPLISPLEAETPSWDWVPDPPVLEPALSSLEACTLDARGSLPREVSAVASSFAVALGLAAFISGDVGWLVGSFDGWFVGSFDGGFDGFGVGCFVVTRVLTPSASKSLSSFVYSLFSTNDTGLTLYPFCQRGDFVELKHAVYTFTYQPTVPSRRPRTTPCSSPSLYIPLLTG